MAGDEAPQYDFKRTGKVDFEQCTKDEQLKKLEPALQRLNESLSGFKYDRKGLALLLAGMQQFMEDALGIHSMYKTHPKIPAKIFRDLSPDGPIFNIATICSEVMKSKGQKRLDWQSPAFRQEGSQLVMRIRQELIRSGHIRTPRIFIRTSCPEYARLNREAREMGAEIVSSESLPGVTHIVCPFGSGGDPDDGKHYMRTLEVRALQAYVHHWYLPDSYNEWVPSEIAPELDSEEVDKKPSGPWHVYARWILDSKRYNEWMEEADYETEDAEGKRAHEGGDEGAPGAKKLRAAIRRGDDVVPDMSECLAPGIYLRQALHLPRKVLEGGTSVDISHGQRPEGSGVPMAPRPKTDPNAPPAAPQPHRVPVRASWFKWGSIHNVEREAFSDMLSLYRPYRNHMMEVYRQDASRDLGFIEARRGLEGDVNSIRRTYDFLVLWGLINWRDSDGGAGRDVPEFPRASGAKGVVRLPNSVRASAGAEAVASSHNGYKTSVRGQAFRRATPQAPAMKSGTRFYCSAMPWVDCTDLRYHCTKIPDVDLCPEAFAEGRFPAGCTAKDFVRVTASEAVPDQSGWTDQETLLLLEGMELYGDDWAQVAAHVGGKSQMQCITRILQLPIDETLIQPQRDPKQTGLLVSEGPGGGAEPLSTSYLPFEEEANPVMAQVAFLSSIIAPEVGAAAAKGALELIADACGDAQNLEAEIPAALQRSAAAGSLCAAATDSKLRADVLEREVQRLVHSACELQVRRLNTKMSHMLKIDEAMAQDLPNHRQQEGAYAAALQAAIENPQGIGLPQTAVAMNIAANQMAAVQLAQQLNAK